MITITKQVISEIIAHMNRELPNEGCGYLGGKEEVITQFQAMTNVLNSPKEFAFEPKEQFDTLRRFRENGLAILGVIHSHPNGKAKLSQKDIAHADPALLQLIVIPQTEEVVLFSISGDIVTPQELSII